jgi:hypothetical protein
MRVATAAAAADEREGRVVGVAPSFSGGVHQAPDTTESTKAHVLTALWTRNIPLTLRQLHLETGVPPTELQSTIVALCLSGSVRRLNTVIESFAVGPRRPVSSD